MKFEKSQAFCKSESPREHTHRIEMTDEEYMARKSPKILFKEVYVEPINEIMEENEKGKSKRAKSKPKKVHKKPK